MAASTVWWVVVPPAEQNASSVPRDAKIVSTQVGSTAYNTFLNTDSGVVNGYVRYMGPFNSRQAAQQATPGHLGILDWVKAGIAGVLIGAGGQNPQAAIANSGLAAAPNTCCLFQFPGVAGVGAFCILSKSEARAMIFGLLLAGSALVTFVGIAVLVAAGFERSGAGEAAGGALEAVGAGVAFVPGGQAAGLAIGTAGAAARRTSRQSLERRQSAKAGREREATAAQRKTQQQRETETRRSQRRADQRPKPIEGTLPE